MIYAILNFRVIKFIIQKAITKKVFKINKFLRQDTESKLFIINVLSLGGVPPLLGFSIKILILLLVIKINLALIAFSIILSSLISILFYTRIFYTASILNNPKIIIISSLE
jgi:NADH:ubiquinone oxidoreductase subunit 2 (subunit N)